MKNLFVNALLNLFMISFCFSQNSSLYTIGKDSTYKYIWKIHISSPNDNNKNEYIMTGFKVKGQPYLVTALHGWIRGYADFKNKPNIYVEFFSVGSESAARIKCKNVRIKGGDIEKDLLFLNFDGCEYGNKKPFDITSSYQKEGLTIGEYNIKDEYKAYGFPSTLDPQTNLANVSVSSEIQKIVFNSINQLEVFKKLKSPALDTKVFSLNKECIVEGLSGCPIVNTKTLEVIGIGNGATVGDAGKSWAIKLNKNDIESPKIDKEIEKKDINGTYAVYDTLYKNLKLFYKLGLFSSKLENKPISFSSPIDFPLASPKLILGVSGGLLGGFRIKDQKIEDAWNYGGDIFIEWRPFKKVSRLMLGGFVSKNVFNYDISPFDENGLPPNVGAKTYYIKNTMVGVQLSVLYSRGVFHQAYFGGGLGPSWKELDRWNNYRLFTGYRWYPLKRQRWSLDFKILYYIRAKEKITPLNPFGNAYPKLRTLNELYLCAGINYSIKLNK